MLVWIMALLGILTSFFVKYSNRTSKEKSWSLIFWVKDNYAEMVVSFLSMVMLVIIFQRTEFNDSVLIEKLPWITSLPMDLIGAALAGYLNNTIWYAIVKKAKGK